MDRSPPSAIWLAIASVLVFSVAIVLRVPSCYESFWIDELHSAWAVWDSLSDVTPRAALGHQSPFYFVGLWFWKQAVGESELALRFSSVLALALSSVVLTVGIARWGRSVWAGMAAGMVLAAESNAIFFGTELRPYALVVLFGSVALVMFLHLLGQRTRHDNRAGWFTMNAAVLLAVLFQPTAIGLLLLPAALMLVWLVRDPRKALRFNLSDGFILLGASAVAFALWKLTLNETWQQRFTWSAFASATSPRQILEIWDWSWLWALPLGIVTTAVIVAVSTKRFPETRVSLSGSLVLATLAIVMTSTYWFVSWMGWFPVWHRRYFIAVLPIFAALGGASITTVQSAFGERRRLHIVVAVVTVLFVLALPYAQGTLQRLPHYPVAYAVRGEDWRSAMEWVRSNSRPNDLIYLDAGLIENKTLLSRTVTIGVTRSLTPAESDYLTYAGRGPYELGRKAIPIDAGGALLFTTGSASRRVFLILRQPASKVQGSLHYGSHVYGFGNVSVVVQTSALDRLIL